MASSKLYYARPSLHDKDAADFFADLQAQATHSAAYPAAAAAYPYTDHSAPQDTTYYGYTSSKGTNYYDEYSPSQDTSYHSNTPSSQSSAFSSALPSPQPMPLLGAALPDAQYNYHAPAAQARAPFLNIHNYGYPAWNSVEDIFENAGTPVSAQDIYSAPRAAEPAPVPYITPPPSLMQTRDSSPAAYVAPASSSVPSRHCSPAAYVAPVPLSRSTRDSSYAAYIPSASSSIPNRGYSPAAYVAPLSSSSAVPACPPSPTVYITPASSSAKARKRTPAPPPRRARASKVKRRYDEEDEDDSEDDSDHDDDSSDASDSEDDESGPKRRRKSTRTARKSHTPYDTKARKPARAPKKPKDPNAAKKPLNEFLLAMHDHTPALMHAASYAIRGDAVRSVFARLWYALPPARTAPYSALAAAAKASPPGAPRPRLAGDASIETRVEGGMSGFEVIPAQEVLAALRHLVRASVSRAFDAHVTATRKKRKRVTTESVRNARKYARVRRRVYRRWVAWCAARGMPEPAPLEALFTVGDLEGVEYDVAQKVMEFIPKEELRVQAGAVPAVW
ncbi:hypothetical protein PsYK624_136510 [Phanerochaete sordida]|uniref:Uncharacterized protein n=1 Tax=Phanerochaete sordida TaxID=48140 RepID=A0A9P3GL07_9APHY|nr:hypothetical protein PsYK624_136510 [Phanerochaete sordida]